MILEANEFIKMLMTLQFSMFDIEICSAPRPHAHGNTVRVAVVLQCGQRWQSSRGNVRDVGGGNPIGFGFWREFAIRNEGCGGNMGGAFDIMGKFSLGNGGTRASINGARSLPAPMLRASPVEN